MKVSELIQKLTEETFDNEKEYTINIKDQDGNTYEVTGYDWCDKNILVEKI